MAHARALGTGQIEARVTALADALRAALAAIPGVSVHDLGARRCGIVTLSKDGLEPAAMHESLRAQGFATSVSTADMARFDMDARGLPALLRASVHYYNTESEVARFAAAVADLQPATITSR